MLTGKALASTIIPIVSEASPMTVMASPMEVDRSSELPIELKIPLPASSACSEDGEDIDINAGVDNQIQTLESVETEEKPEDKSLPVLPGVSGEGSIDEDVKTEASRTQPISLNELARLVEFEQFERRRGLSIRDSLDQLSFVFALDRRLISSSEIAYRTLVDQFRANDHGGFAATYQATENLINDCDGIGQSVQVHNDHNGDVELDPETWDKPSQSWLQKLPPAYRNGVLAFLTKIRTNTTFLSECISGLSSLELTALTASYQRLAYGDSVFPIHSLSRIRTMGKDQNKTFSQRAEALRDFHRNDPYFLLLYALFDDSVKPGSQESLLRLDTWSTACAKILEDGKHGSDEFAISALDTFAGFREWNLRPKLEVFLMKVLHKGAFLLDPPQPTDFKQPVEIRNAQAAVAVSRFFDESLKELFALLVNGSTQNGVPESALSFAHAVLGKIKDPRIKLRAKTFITSRWYFSSFISTILVYPESQGIMTEYHIGDTARGSILRELANRMQKQVTDVTSPWNHMTIVTPDIQARVGQFLDVFEPRPQKSQVSSVQDHPGEDHNKHSYPSQLMLTPHDIACLIDFLCPNLSISPTTTDVESGKAPSTASSVTGSSTLTSGSTGIGSAMASSIAPSTSGTSMASNAIIGEVFLEVPFSETHVNSDSPISPLKGLDSESTTLEIKDDSTIPLREISKRIKEGLVSEEASFKSQSANDWGFIYISDNGKQLSLKRPKGDTNFQESNTSLIVQTPLATETDRLSIQSLKEAVIKLMADRNVFHDLMLKIGKEVMASFNIVFILENLFEMEMASCQDIFDFGNSFFWWKSIQLIRQLSSTLDSKDFEKILENIVKDLRVSIEYQIKATEQNLIWHYSLDIMHRGQKNQLQALRQKRSALRIKMWYVSDVRHSAPYEDALHITRALRAMASSRTKQPNGLSNWARHRLRTSFGHDRSEAQTLEAVAAPRDHGGLSKLSDEQVELTSRWLTKNSIENFCKGEERIHRFCFEVQKCVNKLAGVNMLDSPVLWASRLFEREKSVFDARFPRSNYDLQHKNSNTTYDGWHQNRFTSSQPMLSPGAPSSDFLGFQSSYTTSYPNKTWNFSNSSNAYNHAAPSGQSALNFPTGLPSLPPLPIPQNTTSIGYGTPGLEDTITAKKTFAQEVKKTLQSLVISDLGYLLWVRGSETDAWINIQTYEVSQALQNPMESNSRTQTDHGVYNHNQDNQELQTPLKPGHNPLLTSQLPQDPQANSHADDDYNSTYPYKNAYKTLLDRFSYSPDPYIKLQTLTELETLALSLMYNNPTKQTQAAASTVDPNSDLASINPTNSRVIKVPRTKATSLEEVIANCTERRAGTLKFSPLRTNSLTKSRVIVGPSLPNADALIFALLKIFQDSSLRPPTLFRDLQYIAAFVPPSILDQTSQGKAFWDAGLAALALKEDLCSAMITRATQITTYHISPSSPTSDTNLAKTTLRDAARLWLIAAKEGSPVAARELGLFYLTHPELLPRITLPFSKAKDVFRATMGGDQGSGGGGGLLGAGGGKGGANGLETGGLDMWTFAVVFHWMESAANGGDRDARDFLKGNGELSAGR